MAVAGPKAAAITEITNPTPREALELLLACNRRFVAGSVEHPNQDAARRRQVAPAQQPFAVLFGCSDSRLAAEIIFDRGLGDLWCTMAASSESSDPSARVATPRAALQGPVAERGDLGVQHHVRGRNLFGRHKVPSPPGVIMMRQSRSPRVEAGTCCIHPRPRPMLSGIRIVKRRAM